MLVASIALAFAAAVTGPNQPLGGWLLIVVLIAILAGGGMAAYLLVPGSPDAPASLAGASLDLKGAARQRRGHPLSRSRGDAALLARHCRARR